jgi:alpha-glucosidase
MAKKAPLQWWQSGIFYNLYVRSFMDTNGDGIGDLTGVIERLDYLSYTLGVDVLWLSGILDSPWKEFGFDVRNLTGIHPAIGTLETFDELLRWAHGRNMKVIIDFIPNHTSDQHPWFLESRSTRNNPKRDWYIWRDPKEDGTPPNNWLSLFGGSMWEWDEYTYQYYLHTF